MKKSLSVVTAAAMVLSLAACSGNGGSTTTQAAATTAAAETTTTAATTAAETTTTTAEETTTEAETEATEEETAPVEAEPIDAEPILYFGFEDTEGLTAMEQTDDTTGLTGANLGLAESSHPILIAEGQGAVGDALYLDGKYGVDFDMPEIDDDVYTISFWYNADRVATFGPVIQMGRNIGMANEDGPVTWINITKSTWGTNSADIFPVAWNRNSSIGTEVSEGGVWPWIYAMDDLEHGKREWCLLTIVADGNRYVADDGMERVGTKFYLNGELKWEANGENMFYQGLSPEIFAGSEGLEGHIGINYWDTVYKGFIDELYVFNDALTDGQVKTLFEEGNPPESPVAPEYTAPEGEEEAEEAEPEALPEAPVDASAIDVLGTPDRVLGFWSDTTDGFELADGGSLTFKMNNYSDGVNNWDNFVVAFTNTAVTTDKVASADNFEGYAEYGVLRADAFGWGYPDGAAAFEFSWGDDWAGWLALMTDADVVMTIERTGADAVINYEFTGADGTVMTETATLTGAWEADAPVYVHITGEAAYIELLSVE